MCRIRNSRIGLADGYDQRTKVEQLATQAASVGRNRDRINGLTMLSLEEALEGGLNFFLKLPSAQQDSWRLIKAVAVPMQTMKRRTVVRTVQ